VHHQSLFEVELLSIACLLCVQVSECTSLHVIHSYQYVFNSRSLILVIFLGGSLPNQPQTPTLVVSTVTHICLSFIRTNTLTFLIVEVRFVCSSWVDPFLINHKPQLLCARVEPFLINHKQSQLSATNERRHCSHERGGNPCV
jgi:hypothetical protein